MLQFTYVHLFFVSFQKKAAQTNLRSFLQTRIMVDGAKFNSHDGGSLFKKSSLKNGYRKKKIYTFATELKLQVRLSMQSLYSDCLRRGSNFLGFNAPRRCLVRACVRVCCILCVLLHLFSSGEMAGGRSKFSSALNRLALEIPLDL